MVAPSCPHCGQSIPSPNPPAVATCARVSCGRSFVPTDTKHIYCKPACRLRAFRTAQRAAAQAPRVLTPDERYQAAEERIPAGKKPREVPAETRTLEMFSHVPPAPERTRARAQPERKRRNKQLESMQSDILAELSVGGVVPYRVLHPLVRPRWPNIEEDRFHQLALRAIRALKLAGEIRSNLNGLYRRI